MFSCRLVVVSVSAGGAGRPSAAQGRFWRARVYHCQQEAEVIFGGALDSLARVGRKQRLAMVRGKQCSPWLSDWTGTEVGWGSSARWMRLVAGIFVMA